MFILITETDRQGSASSILSDVKLNPLIALLQFIMSNIDWSTCHIFIPLNKTEFLIISSLKSSFGGRTLPSSSLLGIHVKASLVKAAHDEKTFRKALTMQAPPSGQVWKSYYFQGATRLAMRLQVNGAADKLYYLLKDHLGSTTVSYRSDGGDTRTQSYKPWGELRGSGNSLPTDRTYTGQRWEEVGLYFFNARWFDAALGRYAQADSIIPEQAQGVQAWDRYAYVNNNPINYYDHNGNCIDPDMCPDIIGR